jgi:hypothetical protein
MLLINHFLHYAEKLDDYPEVLGVTDIKDMFEIGRKKAYLLVHS